MPSLVQTHQRLFIDWWADESRIIPVRHPKERPRYQISMSHRLHRGPAQLPGQRSVDRETERAIRGPGNRLHRPTSARQLIRPATNRVLLPLIGAVAVLTCGCSGLSVSKSVSPLDFLLPGLLQNDAPAPIMPDTTSASASLAKAFNPFPQTISPTKNQRL